MGGGEGKRHIASPRGLKMLLKKKRFKDVVSPYTCKTKKKKKGKDIAVKNYLVLEPY